MTGYGLRCPLQTGFWCQLRGGTSHSDPFTDGAGIQTPFVVDFSAQTPCGCRGFLSCGISVAHCRCIFGWKCCFVMVLFLMVLWWVGCPVAAACVHDVVAVVVAGVLSVVAGVVGVVVVVVVLIVDVLVAATAVAVVVVVVVVAGAAADVVVVVVVVAGVGVDAVVADGPGWLASPTRTPRSPYRASRCVGVLVW